jgi:hypothetical protein
VLLLLTVQAEGDDRLLACKLLHISHHTITSLFLNTLFFSFLFRVVLIRFAERGLVVRGRLNLKLFDQLYWTIFWAFFVIGINMFPLSRLARGSYDSSTLGRVCLLRTLQPDEEAVKGRISALVFPCIAEFFNQYLSHKVRQYLTGLCPGGRMACIGHYRRNLIMLGDTSRYITYWTVFAFIDGTLLFIPMIIENTYTTPDMMFWTTNLLTFAFLDVFHGVILPLSMTVPWREEGGQDKERPFYTRQPSRLEPRRSVEGDGRLPAAPPPSPPDPGTSGGVFMTRLRVGTEMDTMTKVEEVHEGSQRRFTKVRRLPTGPPTSPLDPGPSSGVFMTRLRVGTEMDTMSEVGEVNGVTKVCRLPTAPPPSPPDPGPSGDVFMTRLRVGTEMDTMVEEVHRVTKVRRLPTGPPTSPLDPGPKLWARTEEDIMSGMEEVHSGPQVHSLPTAPAHLPPVPSHGGGEFVAGLWVWREDTMPGVEKVRKVTRYCSWDSQWEKGRRDLENDVSPPAAPPPSPPDPGPSGGQFVAGLWVSREEDTMPGVEEVGRVTRYCSREKGRRDLEGDVSPPAAPPPSPPGLYF